MIPDLSGLFSMVLALALLLLSIVIAILKLSGVLLLGWWILPLLAGLTLLFLLLGANGLG